MGPHSKKLNALNGIRLLFVRHKRSAPTANESWPDWPDLFSCKLLEIFGVAVIYTRCFEVNFQCNIKYYLFGVVVCRCSTNLKVLLLKCHRNN